MNYEGLKKVLVDQINSCNKVYIVGHNNIDMDSLGGAMGLYAIVTSLNKEAYIVINDNLFPINITEIKTTNINFTLDIENYYSINRNKPLSKIDYSLKGKLPNIIKKYSIKKKEYFHKQEI